MFPAANRCRCTIASTLRSKFTRQATLSNQAPYTSWFLGSVAYLGSAARGSWRGRTLSCLTYTTFLSVKTADLHCDNCAGQNKNRFILWYCAWRVANGLHQSITFNFLTVGQTKFAPDACFGLQTLRNIVAIRARDCGEWERLSEFHPVDRQRRRLVTRPSGRLANPPQSPLQGIARHQEVLSLQVHSVLAVYTNSIHNISCLINVKEKK